MKPAINLKVLSDVISGYLQQMQQYCLGTCKIAGIHSFIIEHDVTTGYTVVFQVRESGGTSIEHFHYTPFPWDSGNSSIENLVKQQSQPPITDWQLKEIVTE